jgi:hypothetical protein
VSVSNHAPRRPSGIKVHRRSILSLEVTHAQVVLNPNHVKATLAAVARRLGATPIIPL